MNGWKLISRSIDPRPIDDIFAANADAHHLKEIPPPWLGFRILPARAAVRNRQVNELLHEEAYLLNHAPSCDDAAHGEV